MSDTTDSTASKFNDREHAVLRSFNMFEQMPTVPGADGCDQLVDDGRDETLCSQWVTQSAT